MRVLITGSNGFIGSHLARAALARGWEVVGLGRKERPASEVTRYLSHDLSAPLDLDERPDAVVHAAALPHPWAPPQAYHLANVVATEQVVRWAETHGLPHLVYVSSSSVFYTPVDQFDLHEGSPIPGHQLNDYARTKLAGERITRSYPGPWAIARPRAVFGVGDTVVLPRLVAAARKGVLPRFVRSDGHQVMADLTPVATVSHYLEQILLRRVTGELNLVNGEPVALNPFVDDVLDRLGVSALRPRVPVGVAMALAGAGEQISARLARYAEPPITRFGISMFASSKTFDPTRLHRELGPAPVSVTAAIDELVAQWQS